MSSLVLDLQNEIYSDKPLSIIIRKAHVIARKLALLEFDEWLDKELNGYPTIDVPDYRKIKGELKGWNPYNGWIPLLFENNELEKTVCDREIVNSIINLEEMLAESGSLSMAMSGEQNAFFSEKTGFQTHFSIFFPKSSIANILTIVRNKILDWTLKLEEENILGEGMKFTQQDKTKAAVATQTVNNFYGNVNYNNGHIETQNVTLNNKAIDYDLANKKLTEIENEISTYNLDDVAIADLKELIKEAKAKIKQKKSPSLIKTALKSLRDFAVSTASNLAATAIAAKLNGFI